jgi:chromatin structure-remodeling complex protein RSC7
MSHPSTFNAGINAIRKLNNAGVYDIHTNVVQYPATMQPTRARIEQVAPEDEQATRGSSVFPPLPGKMARNFYIADTYLETSSAGVISASGVDDTAGSADFLASFQGLSAVSDEIKDLLPPECRKAFDSAVDKETSWRSQWGPESEKMSRRQPVIDKAIVPYSMT